MNQDICDQITSLLLQAKSLGISTRRLYLGEVKMRQLEEWLATQPHVADPSISEFTFNGMKVVRSSQPGMSIGP